MKNCIRKSFLLYVSLFIVIWTSFWFYYGTGTDTSKIERKVFLIFIILLIILILLWIPKYTLRNFTYLIMSGGIFIRILYMLQTDYWVRSHDLGEVSLESTGHAGYIYTIYMTGRLPESNDWQFYHPPLFHWLSAKVLSAFRYLYPDDDIFTLFQCTKIVSCFASCATLIIIKKICDELRLSERTKIIVIALMAFFPNYYLLAGRVNNDALVVMFIMMIVLFTIRWYYNRTTWNIIGIALGFGLGMMTKMNAVTLAVLVGPLFLFVLYKQCKKKEYTPLLIQYIIFAVISFPLGLWYPIRNYIRFKQPFQYVMPIDSDSFLARDGYTLTERFFLDFKGFFDSIYAQVVTDYNIPAYLIKSSMFGEFSFQNVDFMARILLVFNIVLIVISLLAMMFFLINQREKNNFLKWGLFSLWALFMITYISFNISYPFSCTMDYRYVVPTSFIGAVFIGMGFDRLWKKRLVIARILAIGIAGAVGCFSLASIYIYCIVR